MSMHGVLGETTSYPTIYQPEVLYAIPRSLGRNEINWQPEKLQVGVDWWHAFEVSWLNKQGVSQMAIARFAIPASSPNIVESKSLKLYLNSLNFTEFESWESVKQTIAKDLSACVEAEVEVELYQLDAISSGSETNSGFLVAHPPGKCIDAALDNTELKIELVDHPDSSLLQANAEAENEATVNRAAVKQAIANQVDEDQVSSVDETDYQFYSNLLRSNCPVTNQPDWGTLAIQISTSQPLDEAKLLNYILSFRQHNGFHEQCVEQIFADLSRIYSPSKLMVRAWYTRRGGIDINPCRVSDSQIMPKPSRLVRQ